MVKVLKITRLGGVGSRAFVVVLLCGLAGEEKFVCAALRVVGQVNLHACQKSKFPTALTLPGHAHCYSLFPSLCRAIRLTCSWQLGPAQAGTTYVLHKGLRGP